MELTVGVVGAGIVGLSSAINIQRLIKHVHVTIVADKFGVDTVKHDQIGMFLPVPSRVKGVDPDMVKEWLADSYNHHSQMASSPEGQQSGQEYMSGVCFYTDTSGQQNLPVPGMVKNFHILTEEEKVALNYNWEHVCFFETVIVDYIRYLRWLMKEFRETGGNIKFRTVNALQELYGMFDVVVNCTGNRIREMAVDPHFTNHRSRTVQVERHLNKKFILDDSFCMLPKLTDDRWDLTWNKEPEVADTILDDHNGKLLLHVAKAKVPQMEGCEFIKEWEEQHKVRIPPLVQIEMIRCVRGSGPILPVVHNVGHGPDVITLAWGTGTYVAHLVQDCQRLVKPYVPIWKPFDPKS